MSNADDKKWTDDERERIAKMRADGFSIGKMAEVFNVRKNMMSGVVARMVKAGWFPAKANPIGSLYGPPLDPKTLKRRNRAKPTIIVDEDGVEIISMPRYRIRYRHPLVVPLPPAPPAKLEISTRYEHCQFITSRNPPWKFCDAPAIVMPKSRDWCVKCYGKVYKKMEAIAA